MKIPVDFLPRSLARLSIAHYCRARFTLIATETIGRGIQSNMLTEQDIKSAARFLVAQRGVCAPSHAAMRAAALIKEGNQRGGADWLRVKLAAETLLASETETAA